MGLNTELQIKFFEEPCVGRLNNYNSHEIED